jgi:NADH-quinone oxidoreductase subunit H
MTFISFSVIMIKISFMLFVFLWIRWTIPRFRYDQLMNLGWKKLIPLALVNMIITAAVLLWLKK